MQVRSTAIVDNKVNMEETCCVSKSDSCVQTQIAGTVSLGENHHSMKRCDCVAVRTWIQCASICSWKGQTSWIIPEETIVAAVLSFFMGNKKWQHALDISYFLLHRLMSLAIENVSAHFIIPYDCLIRCVYLISRILYLTRSPRQSKLGDLTQIREPQGGWPVKYKQIYCMQSTTIYYY